MVPVGASHNLAKRLTFLNIRYQILSGISGMAQVPGAGPGLYCLTGCTTPSGGSGAALAGLAQAEIGSAAASFNRLFAIKTIAVCARIYCAKA
jgi:hypothetical protein